MTKEKIKLSKDKKEAYELLQSMRGQYAFKDLLDKSQMGVLSNIVDDKSEDSEDTNNKLKN